MSKKIYMLNAIWFKPRGGAAKFSEYLKREVPLIEAAGGKKLRSMEPTRALIGEFDADLIFFVEFPSWESFKQFANTAEYHSLAFMRKEAVEKSLLVRCDRAPRVRRRS
jgi:uncharacterized protein (DUF1330 family)